MVKQFTFWLEGLVEDDPLPDEIKIIVFNIRINGVYKYIELIGYEKEININSNVYYPLEAQFFSNLSLAKSSFHAFYNTVKYLIDESFSSAILKQSFKNRKIYLKFQEKAELLFNV
ncbi:MAG: hypothetical protein E7376_04785 [Clostridiales bacterium]|nr:hypothetical protein [Clostridiales bacterium]